MDIKILELRDRATFIPIMCMNVQPDNDAQRYLMRRVGYACNGEPNIIMTRLAADGTKAWNDPYAWGDRTFQTAHNWIIDNWDNLSDGDVVDVEFILGETEKPKTSERHEVKI